jgi:hypothetical protein
MTAKRVAEWALENAQTQFLIGEDIAGMRVLLRALGLIARFGNSIPEEKAFGTTAT